MTAIVADLVLQLGVNSGARLTVQIEQISLGLIWTLPQLRANLKYSLNKVVAELVYNKFVKVFFANEVLDYLLGIRKHETIQHFLNDSAPVHVEAQHFDLVKYALYNELDLGSVKKLQAFLDYVIGILVLYEL